MIILSKFEKILKQMVVEVKHNKKNQTLCEIHPQVSFVYAKLDVDVIDIDSYVHYIVKKPCVSSEVGAPVTFTYGHLHKLTICMSRRQM